MIIKVKRKHIRGGVRLHANYCPVALACEEQIEDTGTGPIRNHGGRYGPKNIINAYGHVYHMPRSVYRFVQRFDLGKKVKPFNFRLVPA